MASSKHFTSNVTIPDNYSNYTGDPIVAPSVAPYRQQIYGNQYPAHYQDPVTSYQNPFEQGPSVLEVTDPVLEDLIEMLEVEPNMQGFGIVVNGARYSLLDILHAQMKFMFRMNILLIHRQLGRNDAEDEA